MPNGNGKNLTWYTQIVVTVAGIGISALVIWLVAQPFSSWNEQQAEWNKEQAEIRAKQIQTAQTILTMQNNIDRVLEILTEYKDLNKTLWDHNARIVQLERTETPSPQLVAQTDRLKAEIKRILERLYVLEQKLYEYRGTTEFQQRRPPPQVE